MSRAPTISAEFFDFGMGPRNDVHRHQLSDAPRRRGTGVSGGLHRTDVAAHHHGDIAGADVLLADEHDVGRLHHGVCRFHRSDEPFGFDHPERF